MNETEKLRTCANSVIDEINEVQRAQTKWSSTLHHFMENDSYECHALSILTKEVALSEADLSFRPEYEEYLQRRNIPCLNNRNMDCEGSVTGSWWNVPSLLDLTPYCAQIPVPKGKLDRVLSLALNECCEILNAHDIYSAYLNGIEYIGTGKRAFLLEKIRTCPILRQALTTSMLACSNRCLLFRVSKMNPDVLKINCFVIKGCVIGFELLSGYSKKLDAGSHTIARATEWYIRNFILSDKEIENFSYTVQIEINLATSAPEFYLLGLSHLEQKDYKYFTWSDLCGAYHVLKQTKQCPQLRFQNLDIAPQNSTNWLAAYSIALSSLTIAFLLYQGYLCKR